MAKWENKLWAKETWFIKEIKKRRIKEKRECESERAMAKFELWEEHQARKKTDF